MLTKKRIVIVSTIFVVLILLISIVSVRFSFDKKAGMGLSVAFFEKWKMLSVDRIVIETDAGKQIEITDSAIINKILDETTIATHGTSKHGHYERWIYLYNGDNLVRTMKWSTCGDMVELYDADAFHWLFPTEGTAEVGLVYLTEDLVDTLEALIAS